MVTIVGQEQYSFITEEIRRVFTEISDTPNLPKDVQLDARTILESIGTKPLRHLSLDCNMFELAYNKIPAVKKILKQSSERFDASKKSH